jgi:hypothetical protein
MEREARLEALKAALTSWPRVELVRIERRWRGLKAADDEAGIVVVDVELSLSLSLRVDVMVMYDV